MRSQLTRLKAFLPKRRRVEPLLPPAVITLGLGLTTVLAAQDIEFQKDEHEEQEVLALIQASQAIHSKLDSTSQILHGVVGLFNSSALIGRQQFSTYYESLALGERSLAGIQGVGFAKLLQPNRLTAYEAQMRAEGFPRFAVWPNDPRDFYTSITYLEPFDWRNRRAFGYDMWSDPVRRASMARARDTGLPSLSGPVTLVTETTSDVQPGALLYLPIYNQQLPLITTADRRTALIGWAYSPLRMGDLIRAALADPLIRIPKSAEIQVFEQTRGLTNLLFDSRLPEHRKPALITGQQRTLALYGQRWVLRVALPQTRHAFDLRSMLLGIGGVLFSCGLGLGTYGLVLQHRRTLTNLTVLEATNQARMLAAAVLISLDEGLMITDPEGRILQINPAFTRITGYNEREALGRYASTLQSGVQGPQSFTRLWADLMHYGYWQGEFWNRHRNGQVYRQSLSISSMRNEHGDITSYIGVIRDVTREHKEQEQVRYQAQHDQLTGLPNRTLLVERLDQALKRAERKGHSLALFFLDLNRFKPINDQYGHLAGDFILQTLGQRLLETMRASDTVARFGGDEFVVLAPEIEGHEGAITLATKLRDLVNAPFQWEGHSLEIRVSIGIAIYPDHGRTDDELLMAADTAMYAAKQQGEGAIMLFDPAAP